MTAEQLISFARGAPSLDIIDHLQRRGGEVQAFDPTTVGELDAIQSARLDGIRLCPDPYSAAHGADVVVVLTEWPQFAELDLDRLAASMKGAALVDTRNLLDPGSVRRRGLSYDGVGRL